MGHSYLYRALLLIVAAWFLVILFFSAPNLFRSSNLERKLKERNSRIDALLRDKERMFHSNGTLKHPANLTSPLPTVHVCYSADGPSLPGLVASVNSVRKHATRPVHFHVLAESDVLDDLRSWIAGTSLKDIQIDMKAFDVASLKGLVKDGQENTDLMTYARYFYPDLFPNLHGRVVHLDTDTIVQGDISELASSSLNGGTLGVSSDCQSAGKHFTSYKPQYSSFLNFNTDVIRSLHVNASECTFSSGVYVLDVDRWRADNVTSKLKRWMQLNTQHDLWGSGRAGGGSLPALLIVFHRNVTLINPLWNVRQLGWRVRRMYSSTFTQHAKLLHWSGPYKPWMGRAQMQDAWDPYYVPDPTGKHRPVRRPAGQ